MDGCLVPNLTFGLPILEALGKLTTLPLDVHLMICGTPAIHRAIFSGGSRLPDGACRGGDRSAADLQQIRDLGVASGIALNPATDMSPAGRLP